MSADQPLLVIEGLRASAGGNEILHGINLAVPAGEVHAVMGPNGSGKSTLSHVLAGKPGYEVLGGSVTLGGVDLLALSPYERARAGLFLAMQYPVEVPGVSLHDTLVAAFAGAGRDVAEVDDAVRGEAARVGLRIELLDRPLNVDLSGGEKKRNETLQLAVLQPKVAVLDELDSGLDVDALRACAQRVEAATKDGLGVLAITHYTRLLTELHPDRVHVLVKGEIVDSGGPELAAQLEETGYAAYIAEETVVGIGRSTRKKAEADPFADPFADPLQ